MPLIRLVVFAIALVVAPLLAANPQRPNVVFIVSEDNSKHYLRSFDPAGAVTPNIDKLASRGLKFTRAFSCGAVCSVARSTLATGVYTPRIGAQYHRRLEMVTLPSDWQLFHGYLRDAGYYTTNRSKTDYNIRSGGRSWHASSKKAHWRNRGDKNQPFFHMESHAVSHESSLHFSEKTFANEKTKTDPQSVTVWPYFPNTELFRYTTARYHDRMKAIDDIVGRTVAQLEADGELENTFVFYFGDHGGVLPGSKGYAQERGVHVPLVVRIPEKFRHLVHPSMKRGSTVAGFVEFVDFGPTVLHLAGVNVPEHMDGEPFLGKELSLDVVNGRDEAFSHADRFDEKYDFVRALRKGRYKYVRNYHGYYPDGLQNNYRYRMLAYRQWRTMWKAGKLNAQRSQFFEPRPAEQLFDIETDPHELNNLAEDPKHAERLAELRSRLNARLKAMPDTSFYPEPILVKRIVGQPLKFGESHRDAIATLIDTADLALLPFDPAKPKLKNALASDDPMVRYWAVVACSNLGDAAKPLAEQVKPLLKDDDLLVRMRAAEFVGITKTADPVPALMSVLAESDSHVTALLTLNTVVYLRDFKGIAFDITAKDVKAKGGQVPRRLEYLAK